MEAQESIYDEELKLYQGLLNGLEFKIAIKALKIEYFRAYVKENEFNEGIKKVYLEFNVSIEQVNPNIITFVSTTVINL